MKKIFALVLLTVLLLALGACREKSTTKTETTPTETTEETTEETPELTEEEKEQTTTVTVEEPFEPTGTQEENVFLTAGGADPSTIVVDLGDLVTLSVYSERVTTTQLSCPELNVNEVIARGKTVPVTIEAKKEGIFYCNDGANGQTLFKFMVAGMTFTEPEDKEETTT